MFQFPNRNSGRSELIGSSAKSGVLEFQFPNRNSGRSEDKWINRQMTRLGLFQFPNRNSGRSEILSCRSLYAWRRVSIPQSEFGSFRGCRFAQPSSHREVSIPQSEFGSFRAASSLPAAPYRDGVSIPQSEFGSFRDQPRPLTAGHGQVSIPQSEFGSFRATWTGPTCAGPTWFQFPNRNSGRSETRKLSTDHHFIAFQFPNRNSGRSELHVPLGAGQRVLQFQFPNRNSGRSETPRPSCTASTM